MRRFTREFFAQTSQLHWVDDVVFIPKRPSPKKLRTFFSSDRRHLMRDPKFLAKAGRMASDLPLIIKESGMMALWRLHQIYEAQYTGRQWGSASKGPNEQEPAWIRLLHPDIQAELRWYWVMSDHFEPLAIMNDIPCTGVGYAVSENGMIEKIMHALGLYRLSHVRQLAALHHPLNTTTNVDGHSRGSPREVDPMFMGNEFHQDRWMHVLDVHALFTLIGCNVRLSPEELRHGRAASISHDGRTPALGDTTKWIDPQTFDEDLHYPDLLRESPDWPAVRDEFGLSDERLADIILNKGLLGSILDIADKLAYIGRDVWHLIRYAGKYPYVHLYRKDDDAVNQILRLGAKNPYISGIWGDVRRDGDRVFFGDAHRLAAFLELRCWMFRGVYLSPYARFREHTISSVLLKYMYETGQVTAKQLITWGDYELWGELQRRYNVDYFITQLENKRGLRVYRCDSERTAQEFERERAAAGDIVFAEKIPRKISAGGHFLVRHNGRIMPIAEALPKRFDEIEQVARQPYPWHVYAFPLGETKLTPDFKLAIDAYQRRRLALTQGASPGI